MVSWIRPAAKADVQSTGTNPRFGVGFHPGDELRTRSMHSKKRLVVALMVVGWWASAASAAQGQSPGPASPAPGRVPAPGQPAPGPASPANLTRDVWEIAYLDGVRAGFVRFEVTEQTQGDVRFLRARQTLDLTLKRMGGIARVQAETGSDETADGRVLAVYMRQGLAREQHLLMTGTVEDRQLRVKVVGMSNFEKLLPWNPQTIGLIGEQDLLRNRQAKPGDTFDYTIFEPTVTAVVKVRVQVLPMEEVTVEGQGKRRLMRVEVRPEKIAQVQLPTRLLWVEPQSYAVIRSEADLPFLGRLVTVRSTAREAKAPVPPTVALDSIQTIRLDQRIARIHQRKEVTYRVSLTNEADPASVFAQDARQSVLRVDPRAGTLELRVRAGEVPAAANAQPPDSPGQEYLASNYFINSADEMVRQRTAAALAHLTPSQRRDRWAVALAIESWVHRHMKASVYTEAMATADHVARTLEGDCTEYAMLMAAMCRAAEVPARTALGLIYFERNGQPYLAYHMWTEVYVAGQWHGLDATLGLGRVGPGHLKVTDHSWHDTRSLTPVLPVLRLMNARPRISVLASE
jgi:transglutaminase-like putative cysteine protease